MMNIFLNAYNITSTQDPIHNSTKYTLAFLFCMLPLSSSGLSIGLAVAGFLVLLHINHTTFHAFKAILKQPWCWTLMLLFMMILAACAWSPASWADQSITLKKYAKLLCLPLFVFIFMNKDYREWGVRGFLAGMSITTLLLFAKYFDLIKLGHFDSNGSLFRNYIITGHMMAFACFITAWRALDAYKTHEHSIYIYTVLFILFSIELLGISEGRTGYVIYFLTAFLFVLLRFTKKQLIMGLLSCILLIGAAYLSSPTMRHGYHTLMENLHRYQAGDGVSSIGFRLQFQKFAYQLVREKPWLGHGSAGFGHLYELRMPVPAWYKKLLEPHNQYGLIAAEQGLLGVILYILFLGLLAQAARCLKDYRPFALALLSLFAVGNLSDSLLYYSGSGYFFLLMMGLCLGESKP